MNFKTGAEFSDRKNACATPFIDWLLMFHISFTRTAYQFTLEMETIRCHPLMFTLLN